MPRRYPPEIHRQAVEWLALERASSSSEIDGLSTDQAMELAAAKPIRQLETELPFSQKGQ